VIQHSPSERVVLAFQRTLGARDPLAALTALTELRAELDVFERRQVRRALEAGTSYGSIGRALGISRQAAHRRYKTQPTATVISDEVRALLGAARTEAAQAGAEYVECEHVALALAAMGHVDTRRTSLEAARVLLASPRISHAPTRLGPRLRTLLSGRAIDVATLRDVISEDPSARRILERLQA
jgi:hypothetical protein